MSAREVIKDGVKNCRITFSMLICLELSNYYISIENTPMYIMIKIA